MMSDYCPCGNNKSFEECCEPFLKGKSMPETAEQLMRSRYTAFTKSKVDYILKTHEASSRPFKERNKMLKWMNSIEWLGLVIIKTDKGQQGDEVGTVEFRAVYIENGSTEAIHEKSMFKKYNNHWIYVQGDHL